VPDTLDGGVGADTMTGGVGDDTYFVDNTGDIISELAGQGIDTVRSTISRSLGSNQENLTLIGGSTINGYGNTLANTLIGNDAANYLDGGTGADTFAFTTPLNALRNVDTITDFSSGIDKLELASAIFKNLGFSGIPDSDAFFYMGSAAHDMDDRIVYDQSNGSLSYDADGSGTLSAIQFAVLSSNPQIDFMDFVAVQVV